MKRRLNAYGKVYKGRTLPYGTLVGASYELRKAYYTYGYLRDEDMPELPIDEPLDKEYVDPEKALSTIELCRVVKQALSTLDPKKAIVLKLRFGIDVSDAMTLEEIGHMFDLSKERIRQMEVKALRTLKHPIRYDILRKVI
jgi:RNA polymerase primary sigma factor